jgi:hypothetical protein
MAKELIKKNVQGAIAVPETFTINGETFTTALDFSAIHNVGLRQEVEALQEVQNKLAALITETGTKSFGIDVERAKALYRVQTTEVYKKDFKSMKDFAESIKVYVGKSGISQQVAAGLVYSDEEAPATLKSLPVYTLGALSPIINNAKTRKALYEYAASDSYVPFTQALAQEYTKAHSEKKAKNGKAKDTEIEHTYTAKVDSGEVYAPEVETVDSDSGETVKAAHKSLTFGEYKDALAKEYAEVIDLPDKDNMKRVLGITEAGKPTIIYLSIYSEAEEKKAQEALAKAKKLEDMLKKMNEGKLTADDLKALIG